MILLEKDTLLFKLKEFYILEQYQVKLYNSQLSSLEETHVKSAYERMLEIEQQHVSFFTEKLHELGTHPPQILGTTFSAAGFVTGKALDSLNPKARYKLGIKIENTAIEMYRNFITMTQNDPTLTELTKYLWYFMVDEEFHEFWFKEHLSDLGP